MNTLAVIFWGLLLLSFVVLIHEFGHFAMARAFGVRVTEFMIGLPGPSIGFIHKGTRYGITPILLGGYARIAGMEGGDEDPLLAEALSYVWRHGSCTPAQLAEGIGIDEDHADSLLLTLSGWGSITTPRGGLVAANYLAPACDGFAKGEARAVEDQDALLDEQRRGTYRSLPCWKRLAILFAGPFMNLLLTLLIFIGIFSIHGVYMTSTSIYDVVDNAPAQIAGLQAGDRIVALDGQATETWSDIIQGINSHEIGERVRVDFIRDGQSMRVYVGLIDGGNGYPAMGIYAGSELYHMSIGESLSQTWTYFKLVLNAIAQLFNPVTAGETISQSTSVVGIAYEAKAAADAGLLSFLLIIAAVSVSLGFMNLLPIPPLDGGRIVVEFIEKIIKRPINEKLYKIMVIIGWGLLMLLFVVLLFQDVFRYIIA